VQVTEHININLQAHDTPASPERRLRWKIQTNFML